MAVPNVCFTISANVDNCNCTSPPPPPPEQPAFCINTTTTTTPAGNTITNETTTTPTVTTTFSPAEPSTTGPGPITGTTDLHTTVPSPITVELSSPADTNPTPEPGPSTSPTNLYTNTISPDGSTSNTDVTKITSPSLDETTPLITTQDVTKITSPSLDDTTPLLTTQGLIENPTTTCEPDCPDSSGPSAALIAGCTCGALIFLCLCGLLIWWLWKKRKCCFAPIGGGSEAALRDNEEKQVELLKIEKKGTVILTPLDAQPAWPEQDGVLSTSPNPNTDKTPEELSKKEEALPSPTTEGTPDSTTSRKKKKKKKGSRSNRVSPELDQIPAPSTGENDG